MIIRYILSLALLWSLGDTALADDQWEIDTEASHLGFAGTQVGIRFEGTFHRYQAEITFNPDHLDAAHVRIEFDMASAETGVTERDAALAQPEWFAIDQFPIGVFETSDFKLLATNRFEAAGLLTLRGVTREITLPFTLDFENGRARMTALITLDRRDFGIGQGELWGSDQWVAYPVEVSIEIVAARTAE